MKKIKVICAVLYMYVAQEINSKAFNYIFVYAFASASPPQTDSFCGLQYINHDKLCFVTWCENCRVLLHKVVITGNLQFG